MSEQTIEQAIAAEQELAAQAAELRGDTANITPELLGKLYPLLCAPIPAAFIITTPPVKGKPYVSTGIKSVQVQVDRMNAVLSPGWWWDRAIYEQDGKLCQVTVNVGNPSYAPNDPLGVMVSRTSYGGVGQANSVGNLYKGSYTNAAKLAFARLGPGHEVYLGATDLDPDVSEEAAGAQEAPQEAPAEPPSTLTTAMAKALVDRAWEAGVKDRLQLAASHTAGNDVGDCSTKAKATKALAALTYEQGERLDHWLAGKENPESKEESK